MESARKSKEICDEAFKFEPVSVRMSGGKADVQKAISLYEKAIEVDSRNIQAYHSLARIYTIELNDLEKAEYYCRKGYEVTDIPPEISTPLIGVDDICAQAADDFNHLMMTIRLKQGKPNEAQEYLGKMKTFFDTYSKGKYHVALQEYQEYQDGSTSTSSTTTPKGGRGCFIATSVYGSYNAPEVLALRNFRDGVLLTSDVGRTLVNLYYILSPPVARLLSANLLLRNTVRKAVVRPIANLVRSKLYPN